MSRVSSVRKFVLNCLKCMIFICPRARFRIATCEKGKGGLFVCMDGWRKWVLMAARIPSEAEDYLRPVVEKTVEHFGDPVATVHDMGVGGAKAVTPLRARGIPDLICHYHFLAAVGKNLFEHPYRLLTNLIDRSNVYSDLRK